MKFDLKKFLADRSVPIMFIIICSVCIPLSGFSTGYLLNEIVTRYTTKWLFYGISFK